MSSQYEDRKAKRLERYNEIKESMMDDIVDLKLDLMEKQADETREMDTEDDLEYFLRQWEKDYDRIN